MQLSVLYHDMARVKKDKRSDSLNSDSPLEGMNVRMPVEWREKLNQLATLQSSQGKRTTVSDLIRNAIWQFCFGATK